MKIAYTIIAALFFVSFYSCSIEKRAIYLNSNIGEVDGSTYRDFKLFRRSNAFIIDGQNNGIGYRGFVFMNDEDSVELISGSHELTSGLNDDTLFQTKLLNAISEFERIGATQIDGLHYMNAIHYVKIYFSPAEYVLIFDSKPSDTLLPLKLGKKSYVLEDGLRYYFKEKRSSS